MSEIDIKLVPDTFGLPPFGLPRTSSSTTFNRWTATNMRQISGVIGFHPATFVLLLALTSQLTRHLNAAPITIGGISSGGYADAGTVVSQGYTDSFSYRPYQDNSIRYIPPNVNNGSADATSHLSHSGINAYAESAATAEVHANVNSFYTAFGVRGDANLFATVSEDRLGSLFHSYASASWFAGIIGTVKLTGFDAGYGINLASNNTNPYHTSEVILGGHAFTHSGIGSNVGIFDASFGVSAGYGDPTIAAAAVGTDTLSGIQNFTKSQYAFSQATLWFFAKGGPYVGNKPNYALLGTGLGEAGIYVAQSGLQSSDIVVPSPDNGGAGGPVYIGLTPQNGFEVSGTSDNPITGFSLPATSVGESVRLTVGGRHFDVGAGQSVDFTSFEPGGVTTFDIIGTTGSSAIWDGQVEASVVGLRFANSDGTDVVFTPNVAASVPEPSTSVLFLFGSIGVIGISRWRRSRRP